MRAVGDCGERPLKIGLREALGVIEESQTEKRRLRVLNTGGEEIANLAGMLAGPSWATVKNESFVELRVSSGGLSATAKIALDPGTRCTIRPDGTLTGVLPSGAKWIATPLCEGAGS
jgi:hypothetical protein